jgi:plastocyanin
MSWSPTQLTFVLATACLLACGSDGSGPSDNTSPATAAADVGNVFFRSALNGTMNPAVDTVAVNGTVTWTWTQSGTHAVQFADPSLPAGPAISASGAQHSVTFPQPGVFTYDCSIHGADMTGRVVVR